jgi:predicted metal-dependent phosphoesterase TrpH
VFTMAKGDYRKLDMHVHSKFSPDGLFAPKDIISRARRAGMAGVAIVDHNSNKGGLKGAELVSSHKTGFGGFVMVRGVEVSTSDGHLIGLGLDDTPKQGHPAVETAERLRDLGGVVVVPHFGRYISGITDPKMVREMKPDGIEVLNRKSRRGQNLKARRLADEMGCGRTGGSDSHDMTLIGQAFIKLPADRAECEADVLEAIVKGETSVGGRGATIPESASKMFKSGHRWFRRGGRRV